MPKTEMHKKYDTDLSAWLRDTQQAVVSFVFTANQHYFEKFEPIQESYKVTMLQSVSNFKILLKLVKMTVLSSDSRS